MNDNISLFGSKSIIIEIDPLQSELSQSTIPTYIAAPAIDSDDVITARLPDPNVSMPDITPYLDYTIFTDYLIRTNTLSEEFAVQLYQYPIETGASVLENIQISSYPLSLLQLPKPMDRFKNINLPRELRFFVLTRGYLPYLNPEELKMATELPNFYSAWKTHPNEVMSFLNDQLELGTSLIELNAYPESFYVDKFTPGALPDLMPNQIIFPYSENFASRSAWIAANLEYINSNLI